MFGSLVPLFHTRMAIPDPWQCLVWAAPFLAVIAAWWIINRTEQIAHFIFPDLEWEKSLGWLNIKAERRAKTAIRWLGYLIYLLLAAVLYAIIRLADGFPALDAWPDPRIVDDLALRIPALVVCVGAWLLFLGCWLLPKIRSDREEAELRKYRAEMKSVEEERERYDPRSRVKAPLQKPRTNPPPVRTKRRDFPGG